MTRTRSFRATAALLMAMPVVLSGCIFGGDDGGSDEDPEAVVDATLNNDEQISSGVINLTLDVSAGEQGSFEASLNGPFQGDPEDPTAIPQLDWTASATGSGAGQSFDFEGGLIVTEDNAFVEYGGETYEVGTETFSQVADAAAAGASGAQGDTGADATTSFREGCEQAIEAQGGDPAACDFDVSAWFTNLTNEGTEEVQGTDAVHVSGDVDVAQLVEDFIGLAESVPGSEGQIPPGLADQAVQAVPEASFDLFSGVDDDLLRQLDFNLSVDPSAIPSPTPVPVESIDFGFSVGIADVNEEQTVEAPADAKPIDELLGQFGGLGGLGGLGGDLGAVPGAGAGGGLDTGGGAGAGDAYLECVAEAGNDPEKSAACLDEL